jgi:hypothetical protein
MDSRQFRVTEVLLGSGVRPGDTLVFQDLSPENLQILDDQTGPGKKKPRPLEIVDALLFLEPTGTRGEHQLTPIVGGCRFLEKDGVVLGPEPLELKVVVAAPGTRVARRLVPEPALCWTDLLAEVRADCAALRILAARRALPAAHGHNSGILTWIAEHRHEFDSIHGWGSLEQDLFQEILSTASPAEGWAAAQLYAQLHNGELPRLSRPTFGGRTGHDFLLGIAASEDHLFADRARALRLLADPMNVWTPEIPDSERQRVIEQLTPLLKHRDAELCGMVARTLLEVSRNRTGLGRPLPLPLETLTAAYKAAPPGAGRNELAAVLCEAGGAGHWQKVTGNPHSLLGRLLDFERQGPTMAFFLQLESDGQGVYEPPVLLLELLNAGKVIQKKELPVSAQVQKVSWAEKWDGRPLLVSFSAMGLQPGTWRVTPKGTAGKGKDRVSWTGEPQTFVVPAPHAPGYPQSEVLGSNW